MTDTAGVGAGAILYVGDRLDNDILLARDAGMRTAFIRRGPWDTFTLKTRTLNSPMSSSTH